MLHGFLYLYFRDYIFTKLSKIFSLIKSTVTAFRMSHTFAYSYFNSIILLCSIGGIFTTKSENRV